MAGGVPTVDPLAVQPIKVGAGGQMVGCVG